MASTYSTSLRLELMATGDQSGTWGDTTNTNLGTLLEQAITGYLSVAQGDVANLTLTTNNGASDQARNAVINVTGALTATRNVVVQTANKLYTVVNSTTGGFSIVVKTSGGAGISVPPGASISCYSDGTNVVAGQNYANGSIGGIIYLDAGAAVGPTFDLFRDSASPATNDIIGLLQFNGRDSGAAKQEYASTQVTIVDATAASEDAISEDYVTVGGTRTAFLRRGALASGTADPNAVGLPLGQLSFPATPNPSSNGNTLDTYAENTWTPTLLFGGGSTGMTGAFAGRYIKVGKIVYASGSVVLTNKGSSTGTATIESLPFTCSVNPTGAGMTKFASNMTSIGALVYDISASTTSCTINVMGTTGVGPANDTNFNNNSELYFCLVYEASA